MRKHFSSILTVLPTVSWTFQPHNVRFETSSQGNLHSYKICSQQSPLADEQQWQSVIAPMSRWLSTQFSLNSASYKIHLCLDCLSFENNQSRHSHNSTKLLDPQIFPMRFYQSEGNRVLACCGFASILSISVRDTHCNSTKLANRVASHPTWTESRRGFEWLSWETPTRGKDLESRLGFNMRNGRVHVFGGVRRPCFV